MSMNSTYLSAVATAGGNLITHIGLVNASGTELTGGSPAYARQAVTWTESGGTVRPSANLTFNVPGGTAVGGWRGYSASSGGTNYGGADLTQEAFAGQGTYTLLAASTGISHASS